MPNSTLYQAGSIFGGIKCLKRSRAEFANILALFAYVVYTSCTMFNCLTIRLVDIPLTGFVIAQTYVPLAVSLMLAAIVLKPRQWKLPGMLGIVAIGIVFCVTGSLCGRWNLLCFFLLLLAIAGMDYIKLVRCLMWELLITLVVCWVCTELLGYPVWWDLLDGVFVSGRGAYHPNLFSLILFFAVLSIAFTVDRERFFVPLLMVVSLCAVFSRTVQQSDTTFVLLIMLLAALFVERFLPKFTSYVCSPRFFFISLTAITCLIVIFTLVAVALYSPDNQLAVYIDRLLHARIRLPNSVFHEYGGYPIFGKGIQVWTGSVASSRMQGIPMMMLDCAYSLYALREGLAPVICVIIIYCRSFLMLGKRNPPFLLWASFVIISICMVMELTPAFLCLNCTLPFLAEGLKPGISQSGCKKNVGKLQDSSTIGKMTRGERRSGRAIAHALLPLCFLVVILAINFSTAVSEGLNKTSLADSFPQRTTMTCTEKNGEGDIGTPSLVFDMVVDAEGSASLEFLGGRIENKIYKDWVKEGQTYYYLFSDPTAKKRPDLSDDGNNYYSVRIIQPSTSARGETPEKWAWIIADRTEGTISSYWFVLNSDGTAVCGNAPFDYESADSSAVRTAERTGTWSKEEARGNATISIDDGEHRYDVRFGL